MKAEIVDEEENILVTIEGENLIVSTSIANCIVRYVETNSANVKRLK